MSGHGRGSEWHSLCLWVWCGLRVRGYFGSLPEGVGGKGAELLTVAAEVTGGRGVRGKDGVIADGLCGRAMTFSVGGQS